MYGVKHDVSVRKLFIRLLQHQLTHFNHCNENASIHNSSISLIGHIGLVIAPKNPMVFE